MIGCTMKELIYELNKYGELRDIGMSEAKANYIAFYRLLQNNRRKNANVPKIRRVHLSYNVPKPFRSGR